MFMSLSRDSTCRQKLKGWKPTFPKHPCTWNPRYNLGSTNQKLLLLDFWNWNWVHRRGLRLAETVIAGVAMSTWSWDNRLWSDSSPIMATAMSFSSWRPRIQMKPCLPCNRGNCSPDVLFLGNCSESGFRRFHEEHALLTMLLIFGSSSSLNNLIITVSSNCYWAMDEVAFGARSVCRPLSKDIWDLLAGLAGIGGCEVQEARNSRWEGVIYIITWGYSKYDLWLTEMKRPMKMQHQWSSWLLPWHSRTRTGDVQNVEWAVSNSSKEHNERKWKV